MLFTESRIIVAYSLNGIEFVLSPTVSGALTAAVTSLDEVRKCISSPASPITISLGVGIAISVPVIAGSAVTFNDTGANPVFVSISPARITKRPCPATVATR